MATNYCGLINYTNNSRAKVIFISLVSMQHLLVDSLHIADIVRLRHSSRIRSSVIISLIGKHIERDRVLCDLYLQFIHFIGFII